MDRMGIGVLAISASFSLSAFLALLLSKARRGGCVRAGISRTSACKKRAASGGQLRSARSPLPDVPGQKNGGGSAGQASEAAGAEAEDPGGELRCPAELIERDAEQERSEESCTKADAGIEPDCCSSMPRGGDG